MADQEDDVSRRFLKSYFDVIPPKPSAAEQGVVEEIVSYVSRSFGGAKYVLGLGLDFILLCETLARSDSSLGKFRKGATDKDLFSAYPRIERRGNRTANTLSVKGLNEDVGIRRFEEEVADFFHAQGRTKYPSAYVYNTGQWTKYRDLLAKCYSLSASGRYWAAVHLVKFGLANIPRNEFYVRQRARVRLFEQLLTRYPRSAPGENGGLSMMAMAFGWVRAEYSHLRLTATRVRGGSKREHRFGDIDGYSGLDLELSVEAKDEAITVLNVGTELIADFGRNLEGTFAKGIAVVQDVTPEAREELSGAGVVALTIHEMRALADLWDWQKQDAAVQGMLDYLAHIEQDTKAVDRVLAFIKKLDPEYPALRFQLPA